MAIIKILSTIYYTVDAKHPDFKYMENPEGVHEFTDCYHFDTDYFGDASFEQYKAYIKNDLKLVAGGGYDFKHIHNISFDFIRDKTKIDAWEKAFKERIAMRNKEVKA